MERPDTQSALASAKAKPLSKEQVGADMATLNAMLGTLNQVGEQSKVMAPDDAADALRMMEATAAAIPADAMASAPKPPASAITRAPLPTPPPEPTPVSAPSPLAVAEPAPAPAVPAGGAKSGDLIWAARMFMFTGLPGSGKSYVARVADVQEINLSDAIRTTIFTLMGFPDASRQSAGPVLDKIRAWGRGEALDFNLERGAVTALLRQAVVGVGDGWVNQFGKAGADYWARVALGRVIGGAPVVFTGIQTLAEFQALSAAGAHHYHVMCSASTWVARTKGREDIKDPLAAGIEAQATRKASAEPTGPKMRAVWSDEKVAPISARFQSISEWAQVVQNS